MVSPVKYHLGGFPPEILDWQALIPLIGPANAALARYDGTLQVIPNAAVLLSPLMTQEAVLSSKIEGTQATMGEVLEFEAEGDTKILPSEKRNDIEEILNYRQAIHHAEMLLKKLPICQRVVKETHKVLMQGVRGHKKAPGEYRKGSNWIGPPGCSIEEANFIPIAANGLPDAMSVWEKYIHSEPKDRLVQLAILHAEFEALHPFLDGNGRLGRMLIPLFMEKSGLLSGPMFYISAFFEKNRDEYYERLLAVSRDGEWTQWVAYFLEAIIKQAEENQRKASSILGLYEKKKEEFLKSVHSHYSILALDFIFQRPIFRSPDFTSNTGIPLGSAKRILKLLRENGTLLTIRRGSGRRASIYAFPTLLNIAEGKNIFKVNI